MTYLTPRARRIPLFAKVDASGTTMFAWNISDGGVYLKAPGLAPEQTRVGHPLTLSFELPDEGPPVSVKARVAWIDDADREHRPEKALGLGMRFDETPEGFTARVRHLVESFRYRVAMLGFPEPALASEAFGDLFRIEHVSNAEELRKTASTGHVGLLIVGEANGKEVALDAVRHVLQGKQVERLPPVLCFSTEACPDLTTLVESHGQVNYSRPPAEALELRGQVQLAVESYMLAHENEILAGELGMAFERRRRENEYLRGRPVLSRRLDELVGVSEAMRQLHTMVERIAQFDTSVVITGETGTGKELVARALHRLSPRVGGAFVAQNCAAFAETLLDSELFGHARGAFTGANSDRPGLFEAGDGGTVFLDEIGEMTPSMQAKLLRVLQEGEIKRVGETRTRRVDVRLICATHRDLDALVREGIFREDLFYRLRAFVVHLPPLRERREDIPELAMHFLGRLTKRHGWMVEGFTPEAMALLQAHEWPGNVRELEHTVERVLVLCDEGGVIGAELVREALDPRRSDEDLPGGRDRAGRSLAAALEDYEREIIVTELERSGGVIAKAARALGMERSTLSRRLRKLGVRQDES